jgi:uncharacterized membrane protein YoaT (DUF817 family)
MKDFVIDFIYFGVKQARSALFAGLFLCVLVVSPYVHVFGLLRYDFIFVATVLIQLVLIATKLETIEEAKYILLFHAIGFLLEVYKTSALVGSWSYPEAGYIKLFDVPLYSGFMYATVGSYMAHAWRVMRLHLSGKPRFRFALVLAFLIYLNFFTNHFVWDFRPFLFCIIVLLYARTWVHFIPRTTEYRMPLIAGFTLIAFFVWIAENIGTFSGAWIYPNQAAVWQMVSFHKVSSWFLMVIICFIVVSYFKDERHRVAGT